MKQYSEIKIIYEIKLKYFRLCLNQMRLSVKKRYSSSCQ